MTCRGTHNMLHSSRTTGARRRPRGSPRKSLGPASLWDPRAVSSDQGPVAVPGPWNCQRDPAGKHVVPMLGGKDRLGVAAPRAALSAPRVRGRPAPRDARARPTIPGSAAGNDRTARPGSAPALTCSPLGLVERALDQGRADILARALRVSDTVTVGEMRDHATGHVLERRGLRMDRTLERLLRHVRSCYHDLILLERLVGMVSYYSFDFRPSRSARRAHLAPRAQVTCLAECAGRTWSDDVAQFIAQAAMGARTRGHGIGPEARPLIARCRRVLRRLIERRGQLLRWPSAARGRGSLRPRKPSISTSIETFTTCPPGTLEAVAGLALRVYRLAPQEAAHRGVFMERWPLRRLRRLLRLGAFVAVARSATRQPASPAVDAYILVFPPGTRLPKGGRRLVGKFPSLCLAYAHMMQRRPGARRAALACAWNAHLVALQMTPAQFHVGDIMTGNVPSARFVLSNRGTLDLARFFGWHVALVPVDPIFRRALLPLGDTTFLRRLLETHARQVLMRPDRCPRRHEPRHRNVVARRTTPTGHIVMDKAAHGWSPEVPRRRAK